jgi:hypothetical protein
MELKVIVPTSLDEITLAQYQRFAKIEGDEEFLTKKMLEIFCNVPMERLPSIRFKDVSKVFKRISTMMNGKPKLKQRFNLGDKEFGFIPSLDDISYGEFVDLDTYLTDIQNLHKTMAILYRPVTGKVGKHYVVEPYESSDKYCDLMKDAPMDVVMGAVVFFWTLGKELLMATLNSLEKETNKTTRKNLNSQILGDGITPSIPLLKAMLEDLTRLQDYPFTSASLSLIMKSKKTKSKKTLSKQTLNETVL